MRTVSDKHSLPPNPIFKTVDRSDGDPRTWPTSTTEILDEAGHVNYMKPIHIDDSAAIKWRKELGAALKAHFKWDAGNYVLADWPKGYAMYDHHKGKREAPRHDIYLFGSTSKFRSVPEFIPHLVWLADINGPPCVCKYCTKRKQTEITTEMSRTGLYSGPPSVPRQPRMRTANVKKRYLREAGIHASVQKTPKLRPIRATNQAMATERSGDLRAIQSTASDRLKRLYRQEELVWVQLEHPIQGDLARGQNIQCWVAIVEEIKFESKVTEKPASLGVEPPTPAPLSEKFAESSIYASREPTWTVEQFNTYRLRLLAVPQCYTVSEERVIPYQAYIPPDSLVLAMRDTPSEKIVPLPNNSTFDPQSSSSTWDEAVSPFIFAIQQASALSTYWNLTDEWEFKFMVDAPGGSARPFVSATAPRPSASATAPPLPRPAQIQSMADTMNAAYSHNDATFRATESISTSYANGTVSGGERGMSGEQVDLLSQRVLGLPPLPAQVITQVQFQGLWWGAERIWVDELIRLKAPRRSFAPHGTDFILPPSGPGPKAVDYAMKNGMDPETCGAGNRGLFMLLERLFLVEVEGPGGKKGKEVRAAGMLYELADDDWVETEHPEEPPPPYGSASAPVGRTRPSASDVLAQPLPLKKLPQAPTGYWFRPILKPGCEGVFSLSVISGRYYPRVLAHPFIKSKIDSFEPGQYHSQEANLLWALEGLSSGIHNFADPARYKKSRHLMISDADDDAKAGLFDFLQPKQESMDVDQIGEGDATASANGRERDELDEDMHMADP